MERDETVTVVGAAPRAHPAPYIDWPAVLGGAVVAAAIAGLLTTFGAALGLSTISAEPGEGSFGFWAIVTALWVVVSLVASYLAGGYVAGRMRRRADDADAEEVSARDGINGLVVWGLGMLVTAWMAAGAVGGLASAVGSTAQAVGSAVGGVAQGAGAALGNAAQGVAQAADDGAMDYINDTLMRPVLTGMQEGEATAPAAAPAGSGVTPPAGTTTPTPAEDAAAPAPEAASPAMPAADDAELARQTGVVLGNVLRSGEISDADRAFLIAAVAQRTGQSEAEVEARVDQAVAAVQETRAEAERLAEEARQAAVAAAETARISAILSAFLLTASALIAGVAAVSGAVRGGRHRDEGRIFAGLTYRL